MIVTLVAQTKNFSKGLQNAGTATQKFGRAVGGAMNMALGAIGLLATSIIMFLPNFIKMGEEARKSELKLANVAKQMGLFGENTEIVTRRMSKYAEDLYRLTGVNDDLIRENQAILLTFKQLAKSADQVGGAFDRATELTLDLAGVMKTDSSSAAKQLGKVLQDPVKQLGALTKAGVTFTDKEREKIEALVRSNKLLEAQDLILDAIETQVGGTAAETASSVDKMVAAFDIMGGELSEALLPAVDAVADAMSQWLASEDGKKAVADLTREFENFSAWIQSAEGKKSLEDLFDVLMGIGEASYRAGQLIKGTLDAFKAFSRWINSPENAWWVAAFQNEIPVGDPRRPVIPTPNPVAPGTPPRTGPSGVTVNVSGITPTAAIGRTVQDALNTAKRLGVR
jgi:methyl-accepting chemotaxis protein